MAKVNLNKKASSPAPATSKPLAGAKIATPNKAKKPDKDDKKKSAIVWAVLVLISMVFFAFVFKDSNRLKFFQLEGERPASNEVEIVRKMVFDNSVGFNKHIKMEISIFALARQGQKEVLAQAISQNQYVIRDNLRQIIGSASFAQISDPHKRELGQMISEKIEGLTGVDGVEKILFPDWQHLD